MNIISKETKTEKLPRRQAKHSIEQFKKISSVRKMRDKN